MVKENIIFWLVFAYIVSQILLGARDADKRSKEKHE